MIVRLTSAPRYETFEDESGTWGHDVADGVVEGTESPVAVVLVPPCAGVRFPYQLGDRLLCRQSPADPTVAYPLRAFVPALVAPEGTGKSLDLLVAAPAKGQTPQVRLGAFGAGELDHAMAYGRARAELEALRQAVLTLASLLTSAVAPGGSPGPLTFPELTPPESPITEVATDLGVTPQPYGGQVALQVLVRSLSGDGTISS